LHLELLQPLKRHSRILTAVLEPRHPNYSLQAMHDHLYARGLTIYTGKNPGLDTFRLANCGATDRTDIQAFLEEPRAHLDHSGIL
jgi:2-aminoethylphosphonate-pyruvate transaminase